MYRYCPITVDHVESVPNFRLVSQILLKILNTFCNVDFKIPITNFIKLSVGRFCGAPIVVI